MGRRSPGSLRSLRERNRLQVLEVVRGSGSVSRADIARRTGPGPIHRLHARQRAARRRAARRARRARRRQHHARAAARRCCSPSTPARAPCSASHFDHPRRCASRSPTSATRSSPRRRVEVDVDHDAQDSLDAAAALVDEVARRRRAWSASGCSAPASRSPARSTRRTGTVGSSAILPGWVGVAARAGADARGSASPCTSTTTRTSARSPSPCSAPARGASEMAYVDARLGHRRRAHHRRAGSTAAPAGPRARSGTCSSTSTARSAAAATAAAWRRTPAPTPSWTCSAVSTATS